MWPSHSKRAQLLYYIRERINIAGMLENVHRSDNTVGCRAFPSFTRVHGMPEYYYVCDVRGGKIAENFSRIGESGLSRVSFWIMGVHFVLIRFSRHGSYSNFPFDMNERVSRFFRNCTERTFNPTLDVIFRLVSHNTIFATNSNESDSLNINRLLNFF